MEELLRELLPKEAAFHLDIGCGENCYRWNRFTKAEHTLYNDAFDYDKLPQPCFFGDALSLPIFLKPNLFDLVTCFDVIEHFEKNDGRKLINTAEELCNKRIIFFTPLGEVSLGGDKRKYQTHLSGWMPENFNAQGYTCWVFPKFHRDFGAFYAIKDKKEKIKTLKCPITNPNCKGNYWT